MAVAEAFRTKHVRAVEEPEPHSQEEFVALAAAYPDLRLEMTKEGEFRIMAPAGGETGNWNANLTADLVLWNRLAKSGKVFDSSTGFILPNGAKRSPDASWVELSRWEALPLADRKKFLPLCPDFLIELRSDTDRLSELQAKMREYRENGARLGWLIDPKSSRVEIYRPGQEVEILDAPASISGDPVLPGFTLDLEDILS
jgi:Uma2 family endonuclease